MKTCNAKQIALVLGSAGLVLGAPALRAADSGNGGPFIGGDAGVNLITLSGVSGSHKPSIDPGLRTDLEAGYAFPLSDQFTLAPELEVGFLYNSYTGGDLYQVPVLGNLIVSYKVDSDWTLYAGGGAGSEYADASTGNSKDDFAWQVEGGVKYKLGSGDLGLGYKYLDFAPSGAKFGNSAILLSYTFHF
jgi:opacity protein-like surface antigen